MALHGAAARAWWRQERRWPRRLHVQPAILRAARLLDEHFYLLPQLREGGGPRSQRFTAAGHKRSGVSAGQRPLQLRGHFHAVAGSAQQALRLAKKT